MLYINIRKYSLLLILIAALSGCSTRANEGVDTMSVETDHKFTNHLIDENSPYLLQHAHNPVDWYAWGDDALDRARNEDKPIFLSIGYTACHWCHVMEKESFEDENIAAILNEHFVSIKVDREQRPDLDQIYMAATQAMTGGGGWPMTVFLTPDLKPFYAGTYFPPKDGYGRPSFMKVITEIAKAYKENRDQIEDVSNRLVSALNQSYQSKAGNSKLEIGVVHSAAQGLLRNHDRGNGGFGGAPKFPHPTDLSFLLKYAVINDKQEVMKAVSLTLDKMAYGGIYDQLGGGFHRYATDAKWLVPHFEKMLYDNALLSVVYAEAFQATGNEEYRRIVIETLDFVLSEMTDNEGGFYSSLDADSEGEEGKFYVWKKEEIDSRLEREAEFFDNYYNVTAGGNFEHQTNILNLTSKSFEYKKSLNISDQEFANRLNDAKVKLFAERNERVHPFTDDKVLTSWNGLMISGFSWGYKVTGDEKYRRAALKAAGFIKEKLYTDGRLVHSYRKNRFSTGQFLEDYAYLIQGLIDLYEVSYDHNWILFASRLADTAAVTFGDQGGNLYLAPADTDYFMRPKDISDGAIPAPGSVFIAALARLTDITGNQEYRTLNERYLAALSDNINGAPHGLVTAVSALFYLLSERIQVVVVGDENEDFLKSLYGKYLPHSVIIVSESGGESIPLLDGKKNNDKTLAYLCKNYTCQLPAEDSKMLEKQLSDL